ncbi:MAG TPA: FtsX-like permease family protein [Thiothrix sp.]|nr:FtsX-like permease family protein [Thiothrix sp.]
MILLQLTWQSLWNRRVSLLLTVFSIAISIALLLGVDYLRKETKRSFLNTVSGTDLVVGARSGSIQLLLYSVFRIGNPTNNIDWASYEQFSQHRLVKWTVPLSLGDSHKGFRVLGTNTDYFKYYQYADKQALQLASGKVFAGVYDAVLGAQVAKQLGYQLNDEIVIAHGGGETSFTLHKDKPFRVVGILKPTGTAVDRTVHVSLESIEAIHVDYKAGAPVAGFRISAEKAAKMDLQPKVITAFLVGLKTRAAAFKVQREINDYRPEALSATIPGVALAELWQALGHFERMLRLITLFVLMTGLLGMLTTLLSTLNERRREMAILRAIGAHPQHIFLLFMLETLFITSLASVFAIFLLMLAVTIAQPWVMAEYGLQLSYWLPQWTDVGLLGLVSLLGLLLSLLPSWIAYRRALQDGLTIKL